MCQQEQSSAQSDCLIQPKLGQWIAQRTAWKACSTTQVYSGHCWNVKLYLGMPRHWSMYATTLSLAVEGSSQVEMTVQWLPALWCKPVLLNQIVTWRTYPSLQKLPSSLTITQLFKYVSFTWPCEEIVPSCWKVPRNENSVVLTIRAKSCWIKLIVSVWHIMHAIC